MKNDLKIIWKKPKCQTNDVDEVTNTILVSACSQFFDCVQDMLYLDSIPGFGFEIM